MDAKAKHERQSARLEHVEPAIYSLDAARRYLGGIGKQRIYELIGSDELETVQIGARKFVTAESLAAFVARLRSQ